MSIPAEELVAEAAGIVAWKLYQNEDLKDEADNNRWTNRKSRKDRIQYYRWYHGIPDHIPTEVVLQAIGEDWDLS